jgi:hypothetical protein
MEQSSTKSFFFETANELSRNAKDRCSERACASLTSRTLANKTRTRITMLKKEEIQKLTEEQQETLAEVELRLAQKRQRISELSRSYPGFFLVPTILGIIIFFSLIFSSQHREPLTFCAFALFALVQFHASSLNRRLNALIELLDADTKSQPGPKAASDDKVA